MTTLAMILADGIYIGGGVILLAVILVILYLLFVRNR
jgi:hypothetical protein